MNELDNIVASYKNDTYKALRNIFKNQIKGNFLIDIYNRTLDRLGPSLFQYFDLQLTKERMVAGTTEKFEYEICKHIVGLHRSNLIFKTDDERADMEKCEAYKTQLVNEVIERIKLRHYGSIFFRPYPLTKGDQFIYFHLPHDLFAVCIKMNEILRESPRNNELFSIHSQIINKACATLTLLEDGFLDNAYPLCRGTLELYIKFLVLNACPGLMTEYNKFTSFEIIKNCCGRGYAEDFLQCYDSRLNTSQNNKAEYLYYGWVDKIEDYHKIVKSKPYTLSGLFAFLKHIYDSSYHTTLKNIKMFYERCHGYTHGNADHSKYPILHYFEISIMLYTVLRPLYKLICENYSKEESIQGIDISEKLDSDFNLLISQYEQRTTEKFEEYYNRKL